MFAGERFAEKSRWMCSGFGCGSVVGPGVLAALHLLHYFGGCPLSRAMLRLDMIGCLSLTAARVSAALLGHNSQVMDLPQNSAGRLPRTRTAARGAPGRSGRIE